VASPKDLYSSVAEAAPEFPNSTLIAAVGGGIAFVGTGFIYFGLQQIFRHLPTYQMIEAMQGTSNTLCFAGVTATATIMPLMLTIFSFARRSEREFDHWFYRRIKLIALFCVGAFVAGLFTLTVLSAPLGDMSEVSTTWYNVLYYTIVGSISGMVGLLMTILILLYYSILHIVTHLNPHVQQER